MIPLSRPMWLPLRTSHMLMCMQSMCRLLSTTRTSQPRPFQDHPAFRAVLLRLHASPFPLKVCAQCQHALYIGDIRQSLCTLCIRDIRQSMCTLCIRDIRQSMCTLWMFQNLSVVSGGFMNITEEEKEQEQCS